MIVDKPAYKCPKCGGDRMTRIIWGNMFDWDQGTCEDCGYDGELDSMTGYDDNDDGSQTVWQYFKEDLDDEDDDE